MTAGRSILDSATRSSFWSESSCCAKLPFLPAQLTLSQKSRPCEPRLASRSNAHCSPVVEVRSSGSARTPTTGGHVVAYQVLWPSPCHAMSWARGGAGGGQEGASRGRHLLAAQELGAASSTFRDHDREQPRCRDQPPFREQPAHWIIGRRCRCRCCCPCSAVGPGVSSMLPRFAAF